VVVGHSIELVFWVSLAFIYRFTSIAFMFYKEGIVCSKREQSSLLFLSFWIWILNSYSFESPLGDELQSLKKAKKARKGALLALCLCCASASSSGSSYCCVLRGRRLDFFLLPRGARAPVSKQKMMAVRARTRRTSGGARTSAYGKVVEWLVTSRDSSIHTFDMTI